MDEPTGKRCTKCGQVKPPEGFSRDRSASDGRTSQCRECRREATRRWQAANPEAAVRWRAANPESARQANRRWRMAHPESVLAHKRRSHAAARTAVFDHYGRECACCGTAEQLTIDHVNGDGAAHRAEIGNRGSKFYRWLIANGFPDGFQVLCLPCNASKSNGDRCRSAHLSAGQVADVRRRRAAGASLKELADDFGLSAESVRNICRGRTYAWARPEGEGQP